MKLIKQSGDGWHFALHQYELICSSLLQKFPFTENAPVKISKTDRNPESVEREKLLNESLAEHRKELKDGPRT